MKRFVLKLITTICLIILINDGFAQIQVDFTTFTPGDSCKSRTVQFDASSSTGPISSYQWEFKNKTTGASLGVGTGKNITKNFLTPGLYEATLTISDGGTTLSKSVEIRVYQLPQVDFTSDVQEGCLPQKINFIDQSSAGDGTITRWEWNYNDGKKDIFTTATNPSHDYLAGGSYTPTLIITNSFGCTNSLPKDKFITIYDKITPAFLSTNNYSCTAPHTATFENLSPIDGRFNYTWDFGDGTSLESNDPFINHEYEKPGIYSIKLTAKNAPGNCSSFVQGTGVKNVHIGKPAADFDINPKLCLGTSTYIYPKADTTGISNEGKWFFEDDNSVYNNKTGYHTFKKEGIWKVKYVTFNTYSGCYSDTAIKEVEVLPVPTADFTPDIPNGCQLPHLVTFTNLSQNGSMYEWNFGDGTLPLVTTDLSPVSKSYNAFSNYTVRLKVTNDAGCSTTKSYNYIRIQKPSVEITVSPTEGCMPLTVNVKAKPTSNDPVTKYVYDFGNGQTDTVSGDQHSGTYPVQGSFTVKVKIITNQGCIAESTGKAITVNEFCDDDGGGGGGGDGGGGGPIGVARSTDCNQKYTFTFNDTTSNATVISWDFDGTVINSSSNPITYTFPDNTGSKKFMVTATLQDLTTGNIIEHKKRITVVDEKANFTPDILDICKGLTVKFNTVGIDSSNISKYTWDFGDSSARKVINNALNYKNYGTYLNGNASYVYKDTGVFYPKLIIEDKFGCKDSLQYPLPIVVNGPKAYFTIDTATFCKGNFSVAFTDSSKANGLTPIHQWKWDFGDGNSLTSSEDTVVSHQYNNTSYYRNYKTSLTITDTLGCTDKYERNITSFVPRANFSTKDTLRCGKFNISFTNNSSAYVSNYNQYTWKYGNGKTSTGMNGSTVFSDTGEFTITLIVKDDGGCIDSVTKSNYIKLVKPVADFEVGSDTAKCIGTFSLPFTSTSTYSKTYEWDFGDGEVSSTDKIEVSHFYKNADIYTVQLIVTGLDGCKDTTSKQIKIKGPNGTLKIDDYYICKGEPYTSHITGKNIKDYFWDFGDLSPTSDLSKKDSVTHFYELPGKYLPNVILLSPEGCQITLSAEDSVYVDDINAGPDANIECGDTHTMLKGSAALNISGNYYWEGPAGADYIPDNTSLITQTNITGKYILRLKDNLCAITDTAEVTTSGIVPTAFAGSDKKLDCISGTAILDGSTTTADTRFKWTGPSDAIFSPHDSVSIPSINKEGQYILTVIQKYCTKTDTVIISKCSLTPTDTTIKICANIQGTPNQYNSFNLTDLDSKVIGSVNSSVSWFEDSLFVRQTGTPQASTLINDSSYYAKITSIDGTEIGRARVKLEVYPFVQVDFDDIPFTCEGSDTIQITGITPTGGTFTGVNTLPEGKFIPPAQEGDYLVQYKFTSIYGCSDSLSKTATVIEVPSPPVVTDTIEYCQTIDILPLIEATPKAGNTLTWYEENSSQNSIAQPVADRRASLVIYYVSQQNFLCESKRAKITVIADTTPVVQPVSLLDPICQGFTRTLTTTGLSGSSYYWELSGGNDLTITPSVSDTLYIIAGTENITGKIQEISDKGCKSDTGYFNIQVDLLPTTSAVGGLPEDTLSYCIVHTDKKLNANTPTIGTGKWNINKNTDNAVIDTSLPESLITDFEDIKDTIIATWEITNGVCPVSRATVTVLPVQAYYPEVTLDPMPPVCEGTTVTFKANPGQASGDHPKYSFYNENNQLLSGTDTINTFTTNILSDLKVYAKIQSDYHCLYTDTDTSNLVYQKAYVHPVAQIAQNYDTICINRAPIVLNYKKNATKDTYYEWHSNNSTEDLSGSTVYINSPKASGTYSLKVYNPYCPPVFDSVSVKIYEQPDISFTETFLNVDYHPEKMVQLPLVIKPLQYDTINHITWTPAEYLGYYDNESFAPLTYNTFVKKPFYIAQDQEMVNTYEVAVYNGPKGKGCEATAEISINNYIPVNIPNIFSPNGDGLNDYWVLRGLAKYPKTTVKVFNRWGNILYENHDGYKQPWDGTSAGAKVPFGTYYYVVEFLGSEDQSDYSASGWVVVME